MAISGGGGDGVVSVVLMATWTGIPNRALNFDGIRKR